MPTVGAQPGARTLRSSTAAAVMAPTTSSELTSQLHRSNTDASGSDASTVAPAATSVRWRRCVTAAPHSATCGFAGRAEPWARLRFAGRAEPWARLRFAGRAEPWARLRFAGRAEPWARLRFARRAEPWARLRFARRAEPWARLRFARRAESLESSRNRF